MCPAAALAEAVQELRADPGHSAILLDVDGTLAPIVRHAVDAHVPEATRSVLARLARRYKLVACISGRPATTARQMVAIGTLAYVGNHGGEILLPGTAGPIVDPKLGEWEKRIQAFAAHAQTVDFQRARLRFEDKRIIAAFHWRGAPDEHVAQRIARELAMSAEQQGFAVHWGKKVLEVRPPVPLDKGRAIRSLLGESMTELALYAGDDRTDLDAFAALRALTDEGALRACTCVAVGSDESPAQLIERADVVVDGTQGARELLDALLD